ncbi:hypothetical protein Hanom_Chr12g01159301 [Helianthus anomalus]
MLRIICISGCLETSSQVLFLIKALNSFCIALDHSGLDKATLGLVGIGTMEVMERLKMCFGLDILDIARVCIVRGGGSGGGFDIGLVVCGVGLVTMGEGEWGAVVGLEGVGMEGVVTTGPNWMNMAMVCYWPKEVAVKSMAGNSVTVDCDPGCKKNDRDRGLGRPRS